MKHLIPYLIDDQKAADYLRQLRWPNGVQCPRCRSAAVESRERCANGLQRFNCEHCAVRLGQQFAMFTDWTSSIFEESKLCPRDWLLVIGLWQLKLNATAIAAAADIQERTAQRWSNLLDGGIYETYHLDPTRQLEHQVEADECYQSAGSKGLARAVEPTFKGSECPCRFFGLRALHTTKSRGPVRHRPADAGVEHQRAARPLAHLSIIGPVLLVQTRPIPPPPLGLLSGLCCLGSAGHVYAGPDGPVSGSRCRRASPAPSAWLTLRSVRASPATRGRSPQAS